MHLLSNYNLHLQHLSNRRGIWNLVEHLWVLFCRNNVQNGQTLRQSVDNINLTIKLAFKGLRPDYFRGRAPSWMFDRTLNATLPKNLLQLAEDLRKSFPPLGLHKGILDSLCLLFLLIHVEHKNLIKSWTDLTLCPWVTPGTKIWNLCPPTSIALITYKHSRCTILHHLAREKAEGRLPNPWGNTRKSWTQLSPSFPWFSQHSHFVQLHQEQEEELVLGR